MTPVSKNIVLINGPDSKMLIKNEYRNYIYIYIYDNQGAKAYNINQTNEVSNPSTSEREMPVYTEEETTSIYVLAQHPRRTY